MTINKNIIIGIIIAVIFISAFCLIISLVIFQRERIVPEEMIGEEAMIEKQLEELERLREATSPLTEEEIQSQLQELEKLRQETESLSERETQTQLEELEKLRSQ